jgi:Lrp/AsnC family transcriptional regulator
MAKRSFKQIEEDEKKILIHLQKNARESIDEIAKKCGFSRQKVWRIIKRLEDNKDIWGYRAVVDNDKLGIQRYVMLIKRSVEPIDDAISKITKLLLHRKGEEVGVTVESSSYLHGRYDWIIIFTAKDIQTMKKFTHILEKEYSSVISEVHVMEDIFPISKCGIVNPHKDKIKNFV